MLLECLEEKVTVRSVVSSKEDTFNLYNDHAVMLGLVFARETKNSRQDRHYMHSQKRITKNNAGYLQELKDSGVSIVAGLRLLKNHRDKKRGGGIAIKGNGDRSKDASSD
ncbi:hypothetical protein M9H77_35555 [Catharanthus roseus]|uniref:Uncharacterized protein n=1 Tax=Catharanthus roseus TaxID=4058 RepID=A0ACB9ZPM1_CATRO|nr:hypothetical protein M9H77_35555 [Catharanthus roseus]